MVCRWAQNLQYYFGGKREELHKYSVESGLLEKEPIEEFGMLDGKQQVESGWLTSETIIQFKVYNNPIQFWRKKYINSTVS